MLRSTSKRVQQQVDKMRLPVVVRLCEVWRDEINQSPPGGGRSRKMENLQIVMNQLPSMTDWCRITTLNLHDFSFEEKDRHFPGESQRKRVLQEERK
jgi:hypothetical protein